MDFYCTRVVETQACLFCHKTYPRQRHSFSRGKVHGKFEFHLHTLLCIVTSLIIPKNIPEHDPAPLSVLCTRSADQNYDNDLDISAFPTEKNHMHSQSYFVWKLCSKTRTLRGKRNSTSWKYLHSIEIATQWSVKKLFGSTQSFRPNRKMWVNVIDLLT